MTREETIKAILSSNGNILLELPTSYGKSKIALEELDDGDILSIRLNDGEPVSNVPRSLKEEGHKILEEEIASFLMKL